MARVDQGGGSGWIENEGSEGGASGGGVSGGGASDDGGSECEWIEFGRRGGDGREGGGGGSGGLQQNYRNENLQQN